MAITDLTNTTWVVPAGWSAKHNYGVFSVNYDYEYGTNSGSQTTLRIGYDTGAGDDGTNCIGFSTYPAIFSNTAFTITFTGGTDVTNASLISWLEANGELQNPPAPTDAVTIEYNGSVIASLKAGQSVKLPCKDILMHTDVVVSVPDGMGAGEVVEEWDGSYTVSGGVELIDFAIGLEAYKAEVGMNWVEWVDSIYNTGGFVLTGLTVRNSGGLAVAAGGSTVTATNTINNGWFYTLVSNDSND